MESGHQRDSRKHSNDITALNENANPPLSSPLSCTSLDDFFLVDGRCVAKLDEDALLSSKDFSSNRSPKSVNEDALLSSKGFSSDRSPKSVNEDTLLSSKDFSSDQSPKSVELSDQGSQTSSFPMEASIISPDSSSLDGLSVTQSPKIQVMDRSEEPDPYRIPASVFARSQSTTPMEWSVASNESLFSIHVGNNSLSKDHIFLMGRSGELEKSGESLNFPNFPVDPTPVNTGEDAKESMESTGDLVVNEAASETVKEILRVAAIDHSRQKMPPANGVHHCSSHSRRSDGSGVSISSFAFPIKKRCAWPFCYYTWPFCYCCNCSWACCHCCKCSWTCCNCCSCIRACFHCCNRKRVNSCSCASSTLTEGGRSSDSGKPESELQLHKQVQPQPQPGPQPQPQPLTPRTRPNDAGGKLFSCVSCCPTCC